MQACVRLCLDMSEWFPVIVGLRHGCAMSPWLFKCIYIWCGARGECKGAWDRAGTAE